MVLNIPFEEFFEPYLYPACKLGHVEVVRALLSTGARADQQDEDGVSPLFAACVQPATNTQNSKPRPPTTNAKEN